MPDVTQRKVCHLGDMNVVVVKLLQRIEEKRDLRNFVTELSFSYWKMWGRIRPHESETVPAITVPALLQNLNCCVLGKICPSNVSFSKRACKIISRSFGQGLVLEETTYFSQCHIVI